MCLVDNTGKYPEQASHAELGTGSCRWKVTPVPRKMIAGMSPDGAKGNQSSTQAQASRFQLSSEPHAVEITLFLSLFSVELLSVKLLEKHLQKP